MNKKELRKVYLEKRNSLSMEQCHTMSLSIADAFFSSISLPTSKLVYFHLFLPIKGKKEVNTYPILNKLLTHFPNIKIALSKSDFEDYSMLFFEYSPETVLVENNYGIPEPTGGHLITPDQMDFVLVPLLVTDAFGNRIGYGKGFYDRFLANCRPDCKKIGLSFEKPIDHIPADNFDVPLDFCITPNEAIQFKSKTNDRTS